MAEQRALPGASGQTKPDDAIPDLLPATFSSNRYLVLVAILGILIFVGMRVITSPPAGDAWQVPWIWAGYGLGIGAMWMLRFTSSRRVIIAAEIAGIALGLALTLSFAGGLGTLLLEALVFIAIFRLPQRWLVTILAIDSAAFVIAQGLHSFVLTQPANRLAEFGLSVLFFVFIAWIPFSIRARAVTIQQLQATQARLQAEMARTAELAAARERARIARDIHDVLAHSLTVLSIQAQAARQIVNQQPERAAAMLDDIAAVLRESLSESRRVVGLLREASPESGAEAAPGAQLVALAERFAARTGIRCTVAENGTPRPLPSDRTATLLFALQEALTNAFRHGGAQHVWADLAWEPAAVRLTVRDDGAGQAQGPSVGSGNGLRGMRERAEALGGSLSAGPHAECGFVIDLTLPEGDPA